MTGSEPAVSGIQEIFDFVSAQLDEDAKLATAVPPGPWAAGTGHADIPASQNTEAALHNARHTPSRVLAEVAFKRSVLEVYRPKPHRLHPDAEIPRMLRLLAAPYAEQPGYQEDWKP
ncbi:DUF6221 family protein [Streptomyces hydrogenans]|uniref:DUF6221 family protein n=1 Tax=Streptomyces hydrogenans TaxID=1873719 RepID=UPI0035D5C196